MIELNLVNFVTVGVIAMIFAWLYNFLMAKLATA